MCQKTISILMILCVFSAQAKKIPSDSATFQNDTCYYRGKLYSGKIYEGNSFIKKFKNGLAHGIMKQYHGSTGKLQFKFKYKNGAQNGICRSWNDQGVLVFEAPYLNGSVNGTQKEWFDNGQPKKWTSFKPDDTVRIYFHGPEKEWNANGVEIRSRNWTENQLSGPLIERYDNGKIRIKTYYENGHINGAYNEYFENGKNKIIATLKNGVETGIKEVYKEDGYLFKRINHDNDSAHFFYSNGNLNGFGKMKNGQQNGIWKWFYENGQEIVTLTYSDGVRTGFATFYNEDGTINRKVKFVDDQEVILETEN